MDTYISKMIRITITLLIFFSLSLRMNGQKTNHISFHSAALNQKRAIDVSLPIDYKKSDKNYPVIYLFDGELLNDYLLGLQKYSVDEYPQFIIVSIHHVNRNTELVNNKKFYVFFLEELIDKIDSSYRTTNYRVAIGHSFGGAFVLHSALISDKLKGIVAISPTIINSNYNLINDYDENMLSKNNTTYIGYGSNDFSYLIKDSDKLYGILQEKYKNTIRSKLEKYDDEDHTSAILIGMRRGLNFLFEELIFPEHLWGQIEEGKKDEIFNNYYTSLGQRYQSVIIPHEDDLNRLGYYYLSENKFSEATSVFKRNIRLYPLSSNVYDSYAECLELTGKKSEALKYYKKAIKVEEKGDNDEQQLQFYQSNYEDALQNNGHN